MDDILTQLGVGGIFVILVLREVFSFISRLKAKGDTPAKDELTALARDIKLRIDELYKWHDVRDEDQVPVWYLRKSFERELVQLRGALDKLQQATQQHAESVGRLVDSLDE